MVLSPIDPASMLYESEEERRRRQQAEQQARMRGQAPQTAAAGTMGQGSGIQITNRGTNYDNILAGAMHSERINQRLLSDPNAPPDVRATATDLARQRAENQRRQAESDRTLKSGDQNQIAAALQSDDPNGSYLKLMAYKALGMTNLALQEERKLGAGRKVETVSSADGQSRARITFDGLGQPMSGYDQTGRALDPTELRQFATYRSDTAPQTGLPQKGELFVDRKGNAFREVFNPKDPANPSMVPITPGTVPEGQLIRSTQDVNLAAQQAGGRAFGTGAVEQTGQVPMTAPMVAQQPGAPVPTQQAAPVAAPVPPTAMQPPPPRPVPGTVVPPAAAPVAAPPPQMAAPGVAPGAAMAAPPQPPAGVVPGAAPGMVPPGQYRAEQELRTAAGREAIQTAETEPRENIKTNTALATEASKKARDAAAQLSTIDRVIRYTETKPQFFGEWIGSEAFRAFREATTNDDRRDSLNRLAQVANISREDRPEFQKLMNDIRRLELSGITSSGLSATQLNTERESQRAVGAFAVSITDTAESAKAQAMIARATIEYNKAFNRYLGTANKRQSPATLQDDFDQRVGDQIYLDLQQKLQREFPQAQPASTGSSTGFAVINRRPVQ